MSTKRLWDARDLVYSHKQIFEKKKWLPPLGNCRGRLFRSKSEMFLLQGFEISRSRVVGEESCCQLGILNYVQTGLQSLETLYQLYDCRIDGRSTSFTCMVSFTRIIQSYNTIYRFIISFLLEIYEYMKMYYFFFMI